MLPKPSTPLPPSKDAHDDDSGSLISLPSLTTGDTIDPISVLGESPERGRISKSQQLDSLPAFCRFDETNSDPDILAGFNDILAAYSPPSRHVYDNYTESLISVPSLFETESTEDSISWEPPIETVSMRCSVCDKPVKTESELKSPRKHDQRHKKPFKCDVNDCARRLEGFSTPNDLDRHKRSVHRKTQTLNRYTCQIGTCKDKTKIWARADNFKAHLKRVHLKDNMSEEELKTFIVKQPIQSTQSMSLDKLGESPADPPAQIPLIDTSESQYNSTFNSTTGSFLSDKDHSRSLSSMDSVLQTFGHDSQHVVIRDNGNLTFGNDDNAVVASCNLFRVIILPGHSGIQYAYAAESEGERCYISKELLKPYNIDTEVDRVRISWQKFGEFSLTHTWFEILNKDRIGGKADLILGRGYEKQRPNIGEVLQYARESDLTHHESFKLESPSTVAPLQDIESSYNEVTEGECSWASSSDESSTTSRGPVEVRKEKMIGNITLTITRWLRSQFARVLTSAHETTAGSYEGRSAPASGSVQNQKDQVQRAGKRRLSNIDSDGGENDDDDTVRPPYPGTDNIKGKEKEIMRFACPYFKEHLYRKHRQPKFRCVRCWECFDSEQNYIDHHRALVPCELGEREPVEGFDANQERQLQSRKKKSHIVSETEKWNAVYQILFPHVSSDNIPTPFYEYETHTCEALTECQEYVLREIPLRLREILALEFDRDFQIIEQSLQKRAIESTRTIIANLFEEFRKLHQQGPTPAMAPKSNESQDNAGPSSTQVQPFGLDLTEFSSIFSDQGDIDFNFALAPDGNLALFGDVQLQDIPEAPTELENCVQKKSDSGYESNNVEQPDEQCTN
ncbi:hypothetical protein F4679DRAFT_584149 [Xylaria curta]|nr:hypothetical protein F4679DRAFT_584149 [Xylaria curta]